MICIGALNLLLLLELLLLGFLFTLLLLALDLVVIVGNRVDVECLGLLLLALPIQHHWLLLLKLLLTTCSTFGRHDATAALFASLDDLLKLAWRDQAAR